jgi:hypothetical protein
MTIFEFKPYNKSYERDIKCILDYAKYEIPAKNENKSHHHICPDILISKLNFPERNGPFGICFLIENTPFGIIVYLLFNEFVYLKIVAIHPSKRNLHIGSSLMDKFVSQFNNFCILSQTSLLNIPMKRIFYTYNFVKLHEKINDRKNGDSSEWYGLNVNNQNIITQVISGKFDLQYC